jgi:hypothetical protein
VSNVEITKETQSGSYTNHCGPLKSDFKKLTDYVSMWLKVDFDSLNSWFQIMNSAIILTIVLHTYKITFQCRKNVHDNN